MSDMEFQLYKMNIQAAHFGDGSLEQSLPTVPAERIFSALFIEALKYNQSEELLNIASSPNFQMSDTMLYQDGLFLPKPIGFPEVDNNNGEYFREDEKTIKKIDFINENDFDAFVQGKYGKLNQLNEKQRSLYSNETHTKVSIFEDPDAEGGDPYRIGTTRYKDSSLVFIATKNKLIENLMDSLQYSGIGGKRTSGLGRFQLEIEEPTSTIKERLTIDAESKVMLLTSAIPKDVELEKALIGAKYAIAKSSGFAYSDKVRENYRKHDLYKFKAGSTFEGTFTGDIVDVGPFDFEHSVLNYSKPLFLKLEV